MRTAALRWLKSGQALIRNAKTRRARKPGKNNPYCWIAAIFFVS
jgi:hypothetical protein